MGRSDFISPLELIEGNYESAARNSTANSRNGTTEQGKRDIAGKFHYREREGGKKGRVAVYKEVPSHRYGDRIRHPMTEV